MPVLLPAGGGEGGAFNASRTDTLPVPLEPDIEHLRRSHGNNATHTLCFTLIGQLRLPPSAASSGSSLSSSLSLLSHFNCSLGDVDDNEDDDDVTWWLQQLALNYDPVYYALPVVLIAGIVCDAVSAWLLATLLLRTPPSRCQGDVTSDVYLLWLAVTSDLWLLSAAVRALPDYVTGHVIESLEWTDGYLSAINEWLSYACLWLLITMGLNVAVRLNASEVNNGSPVRSDHLEQSTDNNTSNHTHRHRCNHLGLILVLVSFFLFLYFFYDRRFYILIKERSLTAISASCSLPLFSVIMYSLSTLQTIPVIFVIIIIIITMTTVSATISSRGGDVEMVVVRCGRALRSTSSVSSAANHGYSNTTEAQSTLFIDVSISDLQIFIRTDFQLLTSVDDGDICASSWH